MGSKAGPAKPYKIHGEEINILPLSSHPSLGKPGVPQMRPADPEEPLTGKIHDPGRPPGCVLIRVLSVCLLHTTAEAVVIPEFILSHFGCH